MNIPTRKGTKNKPMDKIGFLLLRMNILILIIPECVVKINGFAHNKKGPRSDPGARRESEAQKGIRFHAERVGNLVQGL